jgi:Cu2+-exporting ATPase
VTTLGAHAHASVKAAASTAKAAGVRRACTHCGLDVPTALVVEGATEQFCCTGCSAAYAIITTSGLARYYEVRARAAGANADGAGGAVNTGRAAGAGERAARSFAEFDDPAYDRLYCARACDASGATPRKSTEVFVEGVHCAACVWLIERLPRIVPGVIEARLDLGRSMVRLEWDAERTRLSEACRALATLGYTPHPAREGAARAIRRRDDRRGLGRLAVAGACAGNTMLLALALYAGVFDAMEPEYRTLFRWLSLLIATVAVAWPGSVFFKGAWSSLRARAVTLDVPLALALGVGTVYSWVSTVRGDGEIYFDSLSMLVFALLVARVVQQRQQRAAVDAVEVLFSVAPGVVRRVDETGREVQCAVESVTPGDVVRVLAGECVPVDGVVEEGATSLDESILTGESRLIRAGVGDRVAAGTTNMTASILVRVEATGARTRAGRLMRLIEEASRRRAGIVILADRIAARFVAVILILAAVVLGAWLMIDPAHAVGHAAAMLIVTCPCAVGLATPLAMTIGIGRFASRRVLVKGGDTLERLARPGVLVLDKTGTLTVGRVGLVRVAMLDGAPEGLAPDTLLGEVAALESGSTHPVARALIDAGSRADERAMRTHGARNLADVVEVQGGGVEGRVGGVALLAGSAAFVASRLGLSADARDMWSIVADCAASGHTPVVVAREGVPVAVLAMGDAIREDAADALAALRLRGWSVRVLSGDHPDVVARVADALGIEADHAEGGATPEDKLARITELVRQRDVRRPAPIVMVGDGVNDAGALAAADVGVAVHGGAEASLVAADVHIATPGLAPLVDLIDGSVRTMGVIRVTLAVSLGYNALAALAAGLGLITPILAAVIMPISSLTALAICARSGPRSDSKHGPRRTPAGARRALPGVRVQEALP